MSTPIIGITTQRNATSGSIPVVGSPESYIQAVQNAGGLPLLIPLDLTTSELNEVSQPDRRSAFTRRRRRGPGVFPGSSSC